MSGAVDPYAAFSAPVTSGDPYADIASPVSAPPDHSVGGSISRAFTGALDALKTDASRFHQATNGKPVPNSAPRAWLPKEGVPLTVPGIGGHVVGAMADRIPMDHRALGSMVGDVVGMVTSPISGAVDALWTEPGAKLLDKIPGRGRTDRRISPTGIIPSRDMTPDESHEANREIMGRSLMAVRAAAPVAPGVPMLAKPPGALATRVARFDQAGVTPMLAAGGGKGASTLTNVVAENPLAGVLARGRLRTAVAQAEESAAGTAARYGETRGPQITGENVQAGIQRFARDGDAPTSFAAKANAAYDDVFGKLDEAMAGKTGRPVMEPIFQPDAVGMPQQVGTRTMGGSQIETPATTAALSGIRGGTQSASIGDLIEDATLSKAAKALESAQGAKDMSFGDLRRLRTWTRDAQKNPELRQNIGAANLQRLEGSLTQDIYTNAEKLGSPDLAHQLRRTDQFYAAGQQRIQGALDKFASAKSGEGTYSRIVQAAGSTSSADAQSLLSLKRSLAPDEWGDVAANAVNELGAQRAGSAPAGSSGFSVSEFVTNYNKLSPRGRSILFGDVGGGGARAGQLRAELDNLATVADDLKGIEKGANTSKSAVGVQTVGTLGGLLNPSTTIPTATLLGGMALTGEMLTNPVVVRWLSRVGVASKAGPSAVGIVVRQLGNAAKANAALAPLYQETLKLSAPSVPMLSRSAAETPQQQQ